jgi:hypothetical protein
MTDDYPGGWFGPSWGAPACDEGRHLGTPVGEECLMCDKRFVVGDQGLTMPHAGQNGVELRSVHLDCFLKNIGVEDTP